MNSRNRQLRQDAKKICVLLKHGPAENNSRNHGQSRCDGSKSERKPCATAYQEQKSERHHKMELKQTKSKQSASQYESLAVPRREREDNQR